MNHICLLDIPYYFHIPYYFFNRWELKKLQRVCIIGTPYFVCGRMEGRTSSPWNLKKKKKKSDLEIAGNIGQAFGGMSKLKI